MCWASGQGDGVPTNMGLGTAQNCTWASPVSFTHLNFWHGHWGGECFSSQVLSHRAPSDSHDLCMLVSPSPERAIANSSSWDPCHVIRVKWLELTCFLVVLKIVISLFKCLTYKVFIVIFFTSRAAARPGLSLVQFCSQVS